MPGTVTVACKLPHGLVLFAERAEKHSEPMLGGGFREVTRHVPTGVSVTINGNAHPVDKLSPHIIVGGFALTHGVDADFFAAWMKAHAEDDVVKNHLIYAHDKPAGTEAWAREHAAARSGLEPLDPAKVPAKVAG